VPSTRALLINTSLQPSRCSRVSGRRRYRLVVDDLDLNEVGIDFSGYGVAARRVTRSDEDDLAKLDKAAGVLGAALLSGFGGESGGHLDEDHPRSTP
jgi:hypothetical protein